MAQAVPNHVWTASPNVVCSIGSTTVSTNTAEQSRVRSMAKDGTRLYIPTTYQSLSNVGPSPVGSGRQYEVQFRLRRADGTYRWHIARATPIRGLHGEIRGWVGSSTDIEDQKTAAQTLANLNLALEDRA